MTPYKKLNFFQAPNMPKGFPSERASLAAAEALDPKFKATASEEVYGWTVDIDDGEGRLGSIVQNGSVHWWFGGERRHRQMEARRKAQWG